MSKPSFADLGVSEAVAGALAARGVTHPFPIQRLVLPDALAGADILGRSPTGSGKTLGFGIPLVERLDARGPRQAALVLAPTRELATQIAEELSDVARVRALRVAAVYGGAGLQRQAKLAWQAHVIVATPGRLEDLIERGAVDLGRVRILVLDEADRMLDMGFRPAVDRIVGRTPRTRQTMFFSATLDGAVGRLARAYTRKPRVHEHAPTPERARAIEHRFVPVRPDARVDRLVRVLEHDDMERTLVFVRTKRGADRLVKRLRTHAVEAVAMHGDKSQAQRERALTRFGGGACDILVATDVAARGLDVDGITHVVNFDVPPDSDTYVHRVGRTGRAGRTGVGITFVTPDHERAMTRLARELELPAAGSASRRR